MEEETAESGSSLDEKKEESDEQKEEEWISYPCLPSDESNSLSLTLFDCPPCLQKEDECYVPIDFVEISPMNETCANKYVVYDNPCYFDKSYDNVLFVPNFEMHGDEVCIENVYDKALGSLFFVLYSSWESSLQTIVIGIMCSCRRSCLLCDNHAVMGTPSIHVFVEYHVNCYACSSCLK